MPEAAEVRLTTEYLSSVLSNKIITNWVLISGQYEEQDPVGFEEFCDYLPFLVEEVKCKGKLIYFTCFNEYHRFFILHSMRMTGSWLEKPIDQYCRWYVEIEGSKKIWFRDPRCLATLHFTENEDTWKKTLSSLGPDIMTEQFSLDVWRKIIQKYSDKNVTAFLMDQHIISGCGNYLKSECLYYSKISPVRKISSLTENESEKLYEALRVLSRLAFVIKGLSVKDYVDPYGRKGYFEKHLKVYGKKEAEKLKTVDGRTTWWVPSVQV